MNAALDLFGSPSPVRRARWRCLPVPGSYPAAKVPLPVIPPPKNGPRRIVVVDSFAGGGGASNGVEEALRRLDAADLLPAGHPLHVTYAVNHDEPALAMHAINHPRTIHLPHNVWQVSMRETLGDDLFGLLWLSPDCRDHSTAKGGPITSRAVRDLAWVLVKWLKELPDWQRPWTICLENVGAFAEWSPLIERADGQGFERDPDRIGWTFHQFVHEVCSYGYSAGWDELVACDYGDPTIRKRLKLCFRRDGQPIVIPAPTHGDPKSEAVKTGALKPWPVAADIIDFGIDCPSIFLTREEAREYTRRTGKRIIRPLAGKTDARLAKGVKRHVIDAGDDAFVATCNHSGDGFRGQPLGEPFNTVASARDAHGLVVPHLAAYYGDGSGGNDRSAPGDEPLRTVPTEPRHALVVSHLAPCVVGVGGRMGQSPPRSIEKPWQSTTTKPDSAIAVAHLAPWPSGVPEGEPGEVDGDLWDRLPPAWRVAALKDVPVETIAPFIAIFRGESVGRLVAEPLSSVTANSFIKRPGGASPIGVVVPHLMTMRNSGKPTSAADQPTHTVMAGGANQFLVEASVRPHSIKHHPLCSIHKGGRCDYDCARDFPQDAIAPFISRSQHGGGNRPGDQPIHTVAASDGDQNQVVVPYLVPRYGEREGQEPRTFSAERPMPTPVPDGNQGSLAAVYLAQHNTGEEGHGARRPVSTIVQKGCTQGVVAAHMLSLHGNDRRDGSCGVPHAAVCAGGNHSAVVQATFIKRDFGNSVGQSAGSPVGAITAGGGGKAELITLPLMTAYYSNSAGDGSQASSINYPMPSATTKARFGLTHVDAAPPPISEAQMARARQVAEFLRRHGCWDGGEIVTLVVRGITYVIVDIGMRMLTPRELARAQGFPDSYHLAPIYRGKPLSETEQRHKIGNSVCEKPAAAFVEANYRPPLEWGEMSVPFLEAAE